MSSISLMKQALIDPDSNLIVISGINSIDNGVSRPRNELLITNYRILPDSELSLINKCVLSGHHHDIHYRDVLIVDGPDGFYDHQVIICGFDKNKFDHDPDRLFVYVLDRQLNIIKSKFKYTHDKDLEYKISSHVLSPDKHLIRVVRELSSVTEIDFYLN